MIGFTTIDMIVLIVYLLLVTIDMIVLIVYLLLVLLVGVFFSKKKMKGKEYFKGDGNITWWVTSVSIFATLLSPISFLSIVGNSFNRTWLFMVCSVRNIYISANNSKVFLVYI